ncbi:MAG TPA: HypC/HybG/HupF family hydrogenase formation chaperone [Acidobacteriota bacterium]|jgi:hydrogenase expression/formation protein HypC|nr:HypC/HybG/HupF family hydrogenase formation chaperone [Acidobacteriota bacterium]
MCLAVPGKIVEIFKKNGLTMATVDYGGVRNSACVDTVPEAAVGDYVIVHAGLALSLLDEEEAHLTLEALREMSEAGQVNSSS